MTEITCEACGKTVTVTGNHFTLPDGYCVMCLLLSVPYGAKGG